MIVCQPCQLVYATEAIGAALEIRTNGDNPYQLYASDRLRCPGCGHTIARPGQNPIVMHHNPEYAGMIHNYNRRGKLDTAWMTAKEKAEAMAIKERTPCQG